MRKKPHIYKNTDGWWVLSYDGKIVFVATNLEHMSFMWHKYIKHFF